MDKIKEYKEGFRRYADSTPAGAKIIFNMTCSEYERKIKEQDLEIKSLKMQLSNYEFDKRRD